VKYNVHDAAGNAAEVTRTVNVKDTIAPVITLIGDNPMNVEAGIQYTDAGATATDDVDLTVTERIEVYDSVVDTTLVGTYTVKYNVQDLAGNVATEVTRTVNVEDTIAPVITLIGDNTMNVEAGIQYTDAGATAIDSGDLTLTDNNIVVDNPVNTTLVGTYTVKYNVHDAAGNNATEVTRTVNVRRYDKLPNGNGCCSWCSTKCTNSSLGGVVDEWIKNGTARATVVAKYGEIEIWDTSDVLRMDYVFRSKSTFNEDISKWDVSSVTNMKYSTSLSFFLCLFLYS
jgi:surface protein